MDLSLVGGWVTVVRVVGLTLVYFEEDGDSRLLFWLFLSCTGCEALDFRILGFMSAFWVGGFRIHPGLSCLHVATLVSDYTLKQIPKP